MYKPCTQDIGAHAVAHTRSALPQEAVFATRGLQPFHDFAEGPDWWSEDEHKRVAESILSMKGNLIGFHTYPLREPAVWVGLQKDVLPGGNVTGGSYPTRWATTLEEGKAWGYNAFNTSGMGFGAAQIFEHDCFGHPSVSGNPALCPSPKTPAANDELFNRVGMLWQRSFRHAKALGIQTVLGTEIPLTIPKTGTSSDGTDGQDATPYYKGIFARLEAPDP